MRYIYLLKDPRTNEVVYVGETANIKERYDKHRWGVKADSDEKREWASSLKENGLVPIMEIIATAENKHEALIEESKQIIKFLKNGVKLFNIKNTKTIKQFDGEGNLINEFSNMQVAKLITGIRGRLDRYSSGGYYWTTENNFDKERFLKKDSNKTNRCKKVLQIDSEGKIIAEYIGVRIAGKETGIDHRSISAVAAGSKIRKTAGGYQWKYKNDE
jgi:predicted GIY-YIG superfamily endonuclease